VIRRRALADLRGPPSSSISSAMVDEPDLQKMFEKMSLTIVQANTAWARVENAMAGLLEKLLGDYSKGNIALHIYFAPNNTETRFKIVDTVARVKWQNHKTHDLLGEWNLIHASLGRAKDVRNRLAHGEIQTPGRQIDGKLKFQSRLTASSWDVGRRAKEDNPRQWPGMSVRDVKATADRFFWLAIRIEEVAGYWQTCSLGWKQPPLSEIFARIVDRRQNSGPLSADLKSPKPKGQPQPSKALKAPKLSSKQRRLQALAAQAKKTPS
jgi:hypothetical protein